ncbi:MAG: hypothetical protein QM638_06755 [Nocardioides sp.]
MDDIFGDRLAQWRAYTASPRGRLKSRVPGRLDRVASGLIMLITR